MIFFIYILGNIGNNTLRILSSSNSNLNTSQINIIKNIEFNKIDGTKKLIAVPSSGNLFDNDKKHTNKILYKNISKKIIAERNSKQNNSNDSFQIKNEIIKKCNNININEYMTSSLNKSKLVAKISKGVLNNQSYKN